MYKWCEQCGKRMATHTGTVIATRAPRHFCCVCFIRNGWVPADWHTLCAETYMDMKGVNRDKTKGQA